MSFPQPGTREYDAFIKKAVEQPKSAEGLIVAEMYEKAAEDTAGQLRSMLHQMIELAPGRLFRDIRLFHEKFKLSPTNSSDHSLPEELLKFRIKFLYEELKEYCDACSMMMVQTKDGKVDVLAFDDKFKVEQAFDSLIDLVYVALGTAYLHRFPFDDGWARVQEANMAKERAKDADDPRSTRKSKSDVVKPEGWKPPVLTDLL